MRRWTPEKIEEIKRMSELTRQSKLPETSPKKKHVIEHKNGLKIVIKIAGKKTLDSADDNDRLDVKILAKNKEIKS